MLEPQTLQTLKALEAQAADFSQILQKVIGPSCLR